jgi:hypothetical protein
MGLGQRLYYLVLLATSVAGVFTSGYFFAFHVLHIVSHNNLLERVLQSVTKNGRALLWVAALTAVVIYVFTIFEFAFYRASFIPADNGMICTTLWECYISTLDFGKGLVCVCVCVCVCVRVCVYVCVCVCKRE